MHAKPRSTRLIVSSAACALLLAACAASEPVPMNVPPPPGVMSADLDKDGLVTRQEWQMQNQKTYAAIDTSGDGQITPDEAKSGFKALDKNSDGVITADESSEVVARGDADDDGKVTPNEYANIDWSSLPGDADGSGSLSAAESDASTAQNYDTQYLYDSASNEGDGDRGFPMFNF